MACPVREREWRVLCPRRKILSKASNIRSRRLANAFLPLKINRVPASHHVLQALIGWIAGRKGDDQPIRKAERVFN